MGEGKWRVSDYHPSEEDFDSVLTVEDKVDTSKLLPCLDEDTGEGTKSDLVVREFEAYPPWTDDGKCGGTPCDEEPGIGSGASCGC